MALQKEKMRLVTALGTVVYGEKVLVNIPKTKRHYYVHYVKTGTESIELLLGETVEFTPFTVQKDVRGNMFVYYIGGLGKRNLISFSGRIGAKRAQRVLNEICSDVFSKDGVVARSLSINDIKSRIEEGRVTGVNLLGNYWLSTVFFQDADRDNRKYGIYSLDNGLINKVYMYDDKRSIIPSVETKEIVAFLKVKIDMDRTKKLWASC